ncbi:MAG: response regulator [Desulfovibrio sp.]
MKILIVDDDPISRLTMSTTLKAYGQCDCAEHGQDGLARFAAALDGGEPFDLVFMDIQMPVMDGHTALAAMREAERARKVAPGSEAKAIMITCHDDVKNVSESFFHGDASCYFTKPIDLRAMVARLKQDGLL